MVNPRWRPELANSRIPDGKHNKENRKALFFHSEIFLAPVFVKGLINAFPTVDQPIISSLHYGIFEFPLYQIRWQLQVSINS